VTESDYGGVEQLSKSVLRRESSGASFYSWRLILQMMDEAAVSDIILKFTLAAVEKINCTLDNAYGGTHRDSLKESLLGEAAMASPSSRQESRSESNNLADFDLILSYLLDDRESVPPFE
jgi:hypothetical protein